MNRRFLYVEDNASEAYLVSIEAKKMGLEMHWLPNVPSLEIYPKELLVRFDFALIDCMGTTLNSKDFLNYNYSHDSIQCIATSFEFCNQFKQIPFVHKNDLIKYIEGFYND